MKRSNLKFFTLRKLCALSTSFSLSLVSFPTFANANQFIKETKSAMSGNSGSELTNIMTGIIGNVTQTASQMYQGPQATPDQYQAWNTLQQDVRKNIGNDQMGMQRHFMFPNCKVPPDRTAKPGNLCQAGAPDYMMNDVLKYGQNYINMYNSYVGGAQNTTVPVGMQCLSNGLSAVEDTANSALSEIEKLYKAFEAEKKAFENQQQVNIKNMKELHAELNGGSGSLSQDFKNKDFSSQFPKECNDLLGGQINTQMKSNGLVGLQDNLISKDSSASEYRGNALASVKRQIEEDKKKLSARIRERGIDAASSSTFFNGVKNQPLFKKAMSSVLTPINENIARVNSIINELGIADKVPELTDPSFMTKLDTVLLKSQTAYQDKFILDCMRGSNSVAYSTSISNVLGSFTDVNVGSSGSNMVDFNNKAPGIISNSNNLADLEAGINSINNNNIKVEITNNKNKIEKKTLSQYFSDLKNECTAIYDGRLKPANNDTAALNYKNMSLKAKEDIEGIKKDIDSVLTSTGSSTSFGAIEQAIDDYIYNCQGNEITIKSCSDKDTFTLGAENFCLKKATTCSTQVNSCKTLVQGYVADKTQKLKVAADQHNLAVTQLETRANALVGQINTIAESMAKGLHTKMFQNGMNPQIAASLGLPKDSGYQLPESVTTINTAALENKDLSGLLLKGMNGANLSLKEIDDQMRRNVSEIKKAISDNVTTQMTRAKDLIQANESRWQDELQAWRDIVASCSDAITKKQQSIAEANKKAQEDFAENNKAVKGLCQDIKTQCSGDEKLDSLLEDMNKSAHLLMPDMWDVARTCRSKASGTSDSDEESVDQMENLITFCANASGAKNTAILNDLRDQILENADADWNKDAIKQLTNYMKDGKALDKDLKNELAETPLGKLVNAYVALKSGLDEVGDLIPNDETGSKPRSSILKGNICSYTKKYKEYTATNFCKEADRKSGEAFEECVSRKQKSIEYDEDLQIIAKQFQYIQNSQLKNEYSILGERYMASSCANITETSTPKSFFEQIGQDSIYSPGGFIR